LAWPFNAQGLLVCIRVEKSHEAKAPLGTWCEAGAMESLRVLSGRRDRKKMQLSAAAAVIPHTTTTKNLERRMTMYSSSKPPSQRPAAPSRTGRDVPSDFQAVTSLGGRP